MIHYDFTNRLATAPAPVRATSLSTAADRLVSVAIAGANRILRGRAAPQEDQAPDSEVEMVMAVTIGGGE